MNKKVIKGLLLLTWMIIIFYFSAQVGSDSKGLSEGILSKIYPAFSNSFTLDEFIVKFGTLIRKIAHVLEYIILGILAYEFIKEFNINNKLLVTIIICVLYATSDEIHQLFVPGRSFMILDILLDSLASSAAVVLFNHYNW